MKIRQRKPSHLTTPFEPNFTANQEALLCAIILDRRHNAWVREMLRRRNAAARWRGQPGCSVREVIQTLDALPTRFERDLGTELANEEAFVQLKAA